MAQLSVLPSSLTSPALLRALYAADCFFRLSKRHWGQYHARGPPWNERLHARQVRCLNGLFFMP